MNKEIKVAIVHDWLTNMGGAEKVVLALEKAFPGSPIYTSTYTPENMPEFKNLDVRTTKLQNLPKPLKKLHKFLPTLRVNAFKDLDLSDFDIIISSSSAEAKQVKKTRPDQIHICYCHTPIRYYWSHYKDYKKDPGFGKLNFIIKMLMPLIIPKQKKLDFEAAQKVDLFIANSTTVQKRIEKYYKQKSIVLNPPVDVKRFKPSKKRDEFYVALGRQVPYKRVDLAVKACTELNIPLKVFGNGSEHEKLTKIAGNNVKFFTDRFSDASDEKVEEALNNSKGFIFPAEEDFGIVQVEALAGGSPVIGLSRGGTTDIVEDNVSGVLFDNQDVESLKSAILKAEKMNFPASTLNRKAKRFDESMFIRQIQNIVKRELTKKHK